MLICEDVSVCVHVCVCAHGEYVYVCERVYV